MMILFCLLLLIISNSLKIVVELRPTQTNCFYELLDVGLKYAVDIQPKEQFKYEFTVNAHIQKQWKKVYSRKIEAAPFDLSVNKLASHTATYQICITNNDVRLAKSVFNIKTGLEVMDFELLPDQSDSQMLEKQLQWLDNQKEHLIKTVGKMQEMKGATSGLAAMMSLKMIIFVIIGLVTIVVVNLLFYRELKKAFKERKII